MGVAFPVDSLKNDHDAREKTDETGVYKCVSVCTSSFLHGEKVKL